MKNGQTFFVPMQENASITNYARWEQAFRVFTDIFTTAHPHKTGELLQYVHIIHTISLTYIWDNVYRYDKDFRLHISQFPQHSWGIILQQSWSMRLKDKISCNEGLRMNTYHSPGSGNGHSHSSNGRSGSKDICKRYNRGKCTFGATCHYDHKCLYCFKFGHSVKVCRKLIADRAAGTLRSGWVDHFAAENNAGQEAPQMAVQESNKSGK